MLKIIKFFFLVLLVISISGVAYAQDKRTVPDSKAKPEVSQPVEKQDKKDGIAVVIEHVGNDELGGTLALKVKEKFRTSVLFQLVDKSKKSIRIKVVSRSEFNERPAIGSVYTVIWTFAESEGVVPFYLAEDLGLVTFQNIGSIAAKLVNRTDKIAEEYKYLFE